jgi:hypothetical protein
MTTESRDGPEHNLVWKIFLLFNEALCLIVFTLKNSIIF